MGGTLGYVRLSYAVVVEQGQFSHADGGRASGRGIDARWVGDCTGHNVHVFAKLFEAPPTCSSAASYLGKVGNYSMKSDSWKINLEKASRKWVSIFGYFDVRIIHCGSLSSSM